MFWLAVSPRAGHCLWMAEGNYRISLFEKALHDRSAFSCGVKPIDNWVKNSVSDETKADRLRLWCGTDSEGSLFGVYALNPHSVEPKDGGLLARKGERKPIPVLYLSCLAIDLKYQKQGLGEAMMAHAIEKAVRLSADFPVTAIVLDVYKDNRFAQRLAFYKRLGFSSFSEEDPAKMYLSIADARKTMEAASVEAVPAK
jgi:ribosomal protein S18 acetylase RimI-like enzyme